MIAALIAPVAGYAADTKSVKESIKENVSDAVIKLALACDEIARFKSTRPTKESSNDYQPRV